MGVVPFTWDVTLPRPLPRPLVPPLAPLSPVGLEVGVNGRPRPRPLPLVGVADAPLVLPPALPLPLPLDAPRPLADPLLAFFLSRAIIASSKRNRTHD